MDYKRIKWTTVGTAVLLAGGAVYLMVQSAAIAEQARLYPRIFLVVILAGSVLLAGSALLEGWRSQPRAAADEEAPTGADREGWPLYVLLLAYVVLLDRMGFVLSTILFLLPTLLWLRTRVTTSILLTVVGVLATFVIFRTVMYVSLPAGAVDIYLLELIYGDWRPR